MIVAVKIVFDLFWKELEVVVFMEAESENVKK
jgi:hypothetical protein